MMLDYMRESIEIALKYRDDIDEEFADTIIISMCRDILNHYILLIPNERNHRDAAALSNIEGAEVFNEAKEVGFEFGLYSVLKELKDIDEIMKYIKENAIIVKENDDVIKEFLQIMRVGDELTGKEGTRYLTRRHLTNKDTNTELFANIKNYWKETTENDLNLIGIYFSYDNIHFDISKTIDVHLPKRTFHERGLLDRKEFMNECREEIQQEIRVMKANKNSFCYGLDFKLVNVDFQLTKQDAMEYFNTTYSGDFFKQYHASLSSSGEKNTAKWEIRAHLNPRDFVNRLIKHFL